MQFYTYFITMNIEIKAFDPPPYWTRHSFTVQLIDSFAMKSRVTCPLYYVYESLLLHKRYFYSTRFETNNCNILALN